MRISAHDSKTPPPFLVWILGKNFSRHFNFVSYSNVSFLLKRLSKKLPSLMVFWWSNLPTYFSSVILDSKKARSHFGTWIRFDLLCFIWLFWSSWLGFNLVVCVGLTRVQFDCFDRVGFVVSSGFNLFVWIELLVFYSIIWVGLFKLHYVVWVGFNLVGLDCFSYIWLFGRTGLG